MSSIDLISLVSSIASLILAVGAIWLSIVFYKMSNEAAKETGEAAKGISASVERLEKLFDKLYSDTFSMMRDTVTDMRKHIWNNPETTKSEISEELRKEIEAQVLSALDEKIIPEHDEKEKIAKKLEEAFEEILVKARERKRSVKSEKLLNVIRELSPVSVDKLADAMGASVDDIVIPHIFLLRKQGKISWDGPENAITSDTVIKYIGENKESMEENVES